MAVRKLSDTKFIVPVILDKGRYPRITIPRELAEKFELQKEPFIILELRGDSIILRKARVVEE